MRISIVVALASALLGITPAVGQEFPSRPPWLIIPYPPGGGVDVVARLLAAPISDRLGQQIVIDNKPGASTIIGTRLMAAAQPDGYTIGIVTDSHAINAASGHPLPYDSQRDFVFISQLIRVPLVLIANPKKVPARTLQELVQFAKDNPGKLSAGSIGVASPHHIAIEWFKKLAGLDMSVIPYRGIAASLQAVLSGEMDMMFIGVSVADQHVASGAVRQLGVASPRRLASNPELPTFAEQGFPEFQMVSWYGLVAPAKTSVRLVDFWRETFRHAASVPRVKERIAASGAEAVMGTAEQFIDLVRSDTAKFSNIFSVTGIKPQL